MRVGILRRDVIEMLCDYCNYYIQQPLLLEDIEIFILKLSICAYYFCCDECRERFVREHSKSARLDMFGQLLEE